MAKSIEKILDLIEKLNDADDVGGVVERYRDLLVNADGIRALVERLNERRDRLRRWRGVLALVENLRMRRQSAVKHDLEHATQAVISCQRVNDMADVADKYPIVFTGAFVSSLSKLAEEAMQAGETTAGRLILSRLRLLQLLSLAKKQGLDIRDQQKIRTIVFQVLEARSFRDLLERINENPVILVDAFQAILKGVLKEEGARTARGLDVIVKFRNRIIEGIRDIIESVVLKREAEGGPDEAVAALNKSQEADEFVRTVARFPFVLGEDFGQIIEREIGKAKLDGDNAAIEGLERRRGHLELLGQIVEQLMHPFLTVEEVEAARQKEAAKAAQAGPPPGATAEAAQADTGREEEPDTAAAEAAEASTAEEGEAAAQPSDSAAPAEAEGEAPTGETAPPETTDETEGAGAEAEPKAKPDEAEPDEAKPDKPKPKIPLPPTDLM